MQLLKLRYLQIKRDLSYWVIIIAVGVFFASKEISGISASYTLGLAGVFLFFLHAYHNNRKDHNFINKYFTHPKTTICISYNLITLPISTALLLQQYWVVALGLHIGATLVIFTQIKSNVPKLVFINKWIPPSQFEWIAGLRSSFYLLIPLSILVLFFSPVKFFGPVALFLVNTIFLGFYRYFEPLVMLNPEGLNSHEFLDRKNKFLIKTILVLNIPPLIINSVFNFDIAWFNICFLFGFVLLASCTIYMKYSDYKPNEEQPFHIDSLIVFASVLIPFFLPISYIVNRAYKKKALVNLTNYT